MMNQGSGEQGSFMASTQIYDDLWLGLDILPSPYDTSLETIVDVGNFHIPWDHAVGVCETHQSPPWFSFRSRVWHIGILRNYEAAGKTHGGYDPKPILHHNFLQKMIIQTTYCHRNSQNFNGNNDEKLPFGFQGQTCFFRPHVFWEITMEFPPWVCLKGTGTEATG